MAVLMAPASATMLSTKPSPAVTLAEFSALNIATASSIVKLPPVNDAASE